MFLTELSNPEDSRSPFDPFEKKDENQDFDDAGVDGSTYIKKRHLPNRIIFLHLVPLSETFGRHFTNNYKTTLTIDSTNSISYYRNNWFPRIATIQHSSTRNSLSTT